MGEQNRRAVEGEGTPSDVAKPPSSVDGEPGPPPPQPGAAEAQGAEADERQTRRQAPLSSDPVFEGPEKGVG